MRRWGTEVYENTCSHALYCGIHVKDYTTAPSRPPEENMKLKVCMTLLLIGTGAQCLHAEYTVKDYRGAFAEGSGIARTVAMEEYIEGLGQGISWANSELGVERRQQLYCGPKNLALQIANYRDMIDRAVAKLAKTVPAEKLDAMYVGLILMNSLIETFPCTASERKK
jgi:hypothetical protein